MHFAPRGTLMIQGTTSDAGKSTLVAGLCRLARRGGVRVAPFKPQNMALNSAVTVDGGEIGRAQALQAIAAGVAAHIDLNPVLLKPTSDRGAQVIIHGHARANLDARAYHDYKTRRVRGRARVLRAPAGGATTRSSSKARAVPPRSICASATSPTWVLPKRVDCPVVLVADIDRGGVFAHLVGTLACLSESERARDSRLRHQPVSRRYRLAAAGSRLARSADRQAGARRRAVSARPARSTPRTCCRASRARAARAAR